MKILFVACRGVAEMTVEYRTALRLARMPEVDARFGRNGEETVDECLGFQPESVVFLGVPSGDSEEDLIDRLHAAAPRALMLYLDGERLYVHVCTFLGEAKRRPAWSKAMSMLLLDDLAMATAQAGVG